MTREEWIASADATCAEMIAQEEEIPERQSMEAMVAASEPLVEITRAGIDELEDLGAPDGDDGTAGEIVAEFEDLADAGDSFIEAVAESGPLIAPSSSGGRPDLNRTRQPARVGLGRS